MKYFSQFILLGLIVSSASCSQKNLAIEPILNANQCGFVQQKIVYINSNKQLNQLFKQSFNNPIKSLKSVDFNTTGLILVSMGQQPSAGYSIQLNSATATLTDNVLNIDASLKKPREGVLSAQVITSPCALYKVNKQKIDSIKLSNH